MSDSQDSQAYDYSAFQAVLERDGLTYVRKPTGELIMVIAWLEVLDGNHSKASIDQLVETFRNGAGRGATRAICSKCHDERHYAIWDPKPASLKRHLYHHYRITCFACDVPECGQHFVTKDQAVVHVMTNHLKQKDRKIAATWVLSLYDP